MASLLFIRGKYIISHYLIALAFVLVCVVAIILVSLSNTCYDCSNAQSGSGEITPFYKKLFHGVYKYESIPVSLNANPMYVFVDTKTQTVNIIDLTTYNIIHSITGVFTYYRNPKVDSTTTMPWNLEIAFDANQTVAPQLSHIMRLDRNPIYCYPNRGWLVTIKRDYEIAIGWRMYKQPIETSRMDELRS